MGGTKTWLFPSMARSMQASLEAIIIRDRPGPVLGRSRPSVATATSRDTIGRHSKSRQWQYKPTFKITTTLPLPSSHLHQGARALLHQRTPRPFSCQRPRLPCPQFDRRETMHFHRRSGHQTQPVPPPRDEEPFMMLTALTRGPLAARSADYVATSSRRGFRGRTHRQPPTS